jgi:glutaminyl-tRNA synthetase
MSENETTDFIRHIVNDDVASGKHNGRVVTRFPPEPNGFLHIGHAKSICLNFSVAAEHDGQTYLRFDDTNPGKESEEYVAAIKEDVRWLGFDWEDRLTHASDYFDRLYEWAIKLIEMDKAYVDSLSAEEIREYRGTLSEPGKDSPHRTRSIEENLDLLRRMRDGEFPDGAHVLRAKIDMHSPNINLRDPTLYRIRHIPHQNAGDKWHIYPMYDFAHGLSDAFEGITHSLCTLEFEDHRPLYDWFLDQLKPTHRPQQIEFSRLNLAYALTSKRKLNALVEEGTVSGWDDPRLATLAGRLSASCVTRFHQENRRYQKRKHDRDGRTGKQCARKPGCGLRKTHGGNAPTQGSADELPGRRDRDNDRGESSEQSGAWHA